MYYHDPQERKAKEIVPGVRIRTFWGEKIMLSIVNLDDGSLVPRHTHPHEQAGIVLEGKMELGVGKQTSVLKKGEAYLIPGDIEHYARSHNGPCTVLDIFSPVREEYKS